MSEQMLTTSPATKGGAVVRSGLLSMLGLIALGGTRLVHGSLVSRATDNQTYALVGTLIGVATTAALFLPGGIASAASKFIPFHRGAGREDSARAVHRLLSAAGIASAVVLGALVGVAMVVLLHISLFDAVAVSLLTAVYSVYSVQKGALYGFDRVAPYARLEVAGSVVAVVATVFVIVVGVHAYLAPLTLGYAVLVVGAWWVLRPRTATARGRVEAADRGEMSGYVALASIGGVASAGLLQLLPLLARRFTTPVEVSYFVAGVTLVAPLYFLPRALGMALFPAMAHAQGAGDVDVVRRHADVSTRALLVLLAPLFAGATLVAREILLLFGGADYVDGAAVLQVLLAATYVAVIQVAAVNSLSSGTRRQVRIPVFSAVIGAAVGLIALVPLGHFYGAAGVGVAYLMAIAVGAAGPVIAAWRLYDMSWSGPAARSLGVVFGALLLARLADLDPLPGAGRVLADLSAAVLTALLGVALLRRDIMSIVELVRQRP